MEKSIPLSQIKVGKRARKDTGDIKSLASSMNSVGLLQAIAITKDKKLICGHRRLKAAKQLKWKTIDCRVVNVKSMLEAEDAENEFRKSLTLSEKTALAKRLQEEAQKQHPHGGSRKKQVRQNGALEKDGKPKRARVLAAERAGFDNEQQFRRAETVIDKGIPELVSAMDDGEVPVSVASSIATLPEEDQRDHFDKSTGKFVRPKKKARPIVETVLFHMEDVMARPWGIDEQYGTVAEMFNSPMWQKKENRLRIGEVIGWVEGIVEVYAELHKECQAYEKRWGKKLKGQKVSKKMQRQDIPRDELIRDAVKPINVMISEIKKRDKLTALSREQAVMRLSTAKGFVRDAKPVL